MRKADNWTGHVAVLSFSRLALDRRVLRQCELVSELDGPPLVIAYGQSDDDIMFPFVRLPVPRPTTVHRLKTLARQFPSHLGEAAAKAGFWVEPAHRSALAALKAAQPKLVIANDWPALVVAAAYKAASGALVHYDSHEFAIQEFEERTYWRLVYKPMVKYLERMAVASADSVSTVGPTLAELLKHQYNLATLPAVVRNMPHRVIMPTASETPWPLRILFHGHVLPGRGLEALIGSMPQWRERHQLTIRGDGDAGYLAGLAAQAAGFGCSGQITFERAVAPDDVIPAAARTADVGIVCIPLETGQQRVSMPNKLFEYIGAGLAVVTTPADDLQQIVNTHGIGVACRDASSIAIAEAINGLTTERVAGFKAATRVAAHVLCWEHEREALRAVLKPLLKQVRGAD